MEDYRLSDSITGQTIKLRDDVVIAFLTLESGQPGESHIFSMFPTQRYRFASFPIDAKWDGNNFIVNNDDYAVMLALKLIIPNDGPASSIEDLVDSLRCDARVRSKEQGISNRESVQHYSVFVCKKTTFHLLHKNQRLAPFESESLPQFTAIKEQILLDHDRLVSASASAREDDDDRAEGAYLRKKFFFYNAMKASSKLMGLGVFSEAMIRHIHREELEFPPEVFVGSSLDLTTAFWELIEGMTTAHTIQLALNLMDMELQPSKIVMGHGPSQGMNPARIEMMTQVLDAEMADFITDTYHDYDVDVAERKLESVRSSIHSMMRNKD